MSTIARRIQASPVRISSEVWQVITRLICGGDSKVEDEFFRVSSIGSCLINDQIFENYPMVVKNVGPRLRVYCLYGDNAVSGEDKNEEALSWKPTSNDWHAFLPCPSDEFDDLSQLMKSMSKKFTLYDVEKGIPDSEEDETPKEKLVQKATIDWEAFSKQ